MWRLRPSCRSPSDAGAQQQLRGAERAAGEHHGLGAHVELVPSPSARARPRRRRGPGHARSARRSRGRPRTDQPPGLDPGAHARPGRDRARQVGDVHRPLGVEPAAERAGAALDAAARVSRRSGRRWRRAPRRPPCTSWPLRPIRSTSTGVTCEHLLGLGVLGVELGRPVDPVLARASSRRTCSGARKQVPELITVVPPTARPIGIGIAGPALGDRQPAVAVEGLRAPRAGRRGRCAGPCTGPPRAPARRARPRRARPPRPRRRRRSRRSTTSHSSPSAGGLRSPSAEPASDGSGRPSSRPRSASRSRPPRAPAGRCRSRARRAP